MDPADGRHVADPNERATELCSSGSREDDNSEQDEDVDYTAVTAVGVCQHWSLPSSDVDNLGHWLVRRHRLPRRASSSRIVGPATHPKSVSSHGLIDST